MTFFPLVPSPGQRRCPSGSISLRERVRCERLRETDPRGERGRECRDPFPAVSSRSPGRAGGGEEAARRDSPREGGLGGEGHGRCPRPLAGAPARAPPTNLARGSIGRAAQQNPPRERHEGLQTAPSSGWCRMGKGRTHPSAPAVAGAGGGAGNGEIVPGAAPSSHPGGGRTAPPHRSLPFVTFRFFPHRGEEPSPATRREAAGTGWRSRPGKGGSRGTGVPGAVPDGLSKLQETGG